MKKLLSFILSASLLFTTSSHLSTVYAYDTNKIYIDNMGQSISEDQLINAINNNEVEIKMEFPVSEDDYSILDYSSKIIEKKLSGDNRTSRSVVAVAGTCTLVIFGVTVVIYIYTNMDVCVKIGEQIIDATSELGRAALVAANDFINNTKIQLIKRKIPNRLKDQNGNVDLGKFKTKLKNRQTYREKSGWEIDKDTSRHGGRKWKLNDDKGGRVASLDENGKVLAD